jgi:hypothetical protein
LDETPFLSAYTALPALASRAGKNGRVACLGKLLSLFVRGGLIGEKTVG